MSFLEVNKMALATIDNDLYKELQEFVEKNSIDYPSVAFFLNQLVKKELEKSKKR